MLNQLILCRHLSVFTYSSFALHFKILQQRALPEEIIVSELQVTAKIKEMQKSGSSVMARGDFHQCGSSPPNSFKGNLKTGN